MQPKLIVLAIAATFALSACYTARPVVVQTPAHDVIVPVPVATPAPMAEPMPAPMPAPMPMPMSLHDSVHQALMDGMGAAANNIEVRVDGSKVFLSGHVATKADHDRAHDIAHGVAGVTDVDHSGLKP
jgi:hypothetical protein